MKNQYSTTGLFRTLAESSSIHKALEAVGSGMDLQRYLNDLLEEAHLDIPMLAIRMLASRSFVYQIFDGTRKPGRETLIRMAFALQLSLPQTQRLLSLARRGPLYPRIRRDAAIIYAIEHEYTLMQADEALFSVHELPLLEPIE